MTGPDRFNAFGFTTEVRVPGTYVSLRSTSLCFLGRPDVTPACKQKLRTDPADQVTNTIVGRYPPLYYVLMALPTRMLSPPRVVYVMRMLTGLVSAAFLAFAFVEAQALGRWAVLGVAGAATPMVLYLASVVNPSGLELACAVALWTSAVSLARGPAIRTRLLLLSAVSFIIFANIRGVSLPMAIAALVLPLALASRERFSEVVHRIRSFWWSAPVVLGAATAIAWGELRGRGRVSPFAHPNLSVAGAFGRSNRLFEEGIASFGAFEVQVFVAIAAWLFLWVVLSVMGLWRGSARDRTVLATTFLVALVFPVFVSLVLHPPPIYTTWQGRHGLPLWVGVPILGGAVAASAGRGIGRRSWPAQIVLPAVFAVGQAFAFAAAARRYAVGSHGRVLYFLNPTWGDSLKHVTLLGLALAGFAALAWRVGFSPTEDPRRRRASAMRIQE